MKNFILILFLSITSFCKGQKVIGPSVISWGGTVGYSFDPKQETYIWGTWVNYEFDRRKKVSPFLGIGIQSWNTPQISTRYFIPQAQVGIVTKEGLLLYGGVTQNEVYSVGFGFYTGHQQFRIEYSNQLKTIMFGCGYIIK